MQRLAAFLACALACASTLFAERPLDVRVVPPASTELIGGERATIAWSGSPASDVKEWEAFLSVDGGLYYAFRLTPHLTVDRKSFQFVVPDVGSDRVRLLLRFGDEKREREVELDAHLRIRSAGLLSRLRRTDTPTVAVSRSGESARPPAAGVAEWIEGDRQGRHLRRFIAQAVPGLRATVGRATVEAAAENVVESPPASDSVAAETIALFAPPPRACAYPRKEPLRSASPLSLSTRLNI